MAHTNSTTNLNLSQFIGEDKPDWLTDYNDDMSIIDSSVKAVEDRVSASESDIETINLSISNTDSGILSRISTNEADIDALEVKVGSAELTTESQSLTEAVNELVSKNGEVETAIETLSSTDDSLNGGLSAATAVAYTIANVYDSTQTYSVGDYCLFGNTLYKCTTPITVGEYFNNTKWTSVKVMNEIGTGGSTGSTEASSVTAGEGLSFDGTVLNVNMGSGLVLDEDNNVIVDVGDGLSIIDNKLTVTNTGSSGSSGTSSVISKTTTIPASNWFSGTAEFFYVEMVVGTDNTAVVKVSNTYTTPTAVETDDNVSGLSVSINSTANSDGTYNATLTYTCTLAGTYPVFIYDASSTGAPYFNPVEDLEMTSSDIPYIYGIVPSGDASTDSNVINQANYISYPESAQMIINFVALTTKPTVDIPVRYGIIGTEEE